MGGLKQLAQALEQRFGRCSECSERRFVLLAAERWWLRATNSDNAVTQKIPILRAR